MNRKLWRILVLLSRTVPAAAAPSGGYSVNQENSWSWDNRILTPERELHL
jgi:hypothetical protein